MPTKKRGTNTTPVTLEQALKTLQDLGFKVTPPTSQEEQEKQETSLEKLGFVDKPLPKKKGKVKEPEEEMLTTVLGISHSIADTVYGPGKVTLPKSQASLFNSLVYQDNLAKQAHFDEARLNPYSRCFMIRQGNGQDRHNKFRKQEVSESQFNSDQIWEEATITTGRADIAGVNPANVNTSF